MKKVLVTGATGFVGGWLTRELVTLGHEVHIIARETSDLSDLPIDQMTVHKGDVTHLDSMIKACQNIHTVFHLAGVVGYSKAQRQLMEKVNVEGTRNVVQACLENKVEKLVYMSSVVAIGASFDGKEPLNEDSLFNLSQYDLGYFETKKEAEQIVVEAYNKHRLDCVILNPSTIYGPGDAKKGSRGVQLKVAKGKFPFYTSGGASIVSVKDIVAAVLRAWEVGRSGERYILCGENITIRQLFSMIAEEAGVKPPTKYLPNFVVKTIGIVGDLMEGLGKKGPLNSENARVSTMYHWFDHSKATTELDFHPRSAKECISESVQWSKENGLLDAGNS